MLSQNLKDISTLTLLMKSPEFLGEKYGFLKYNHRRVKSKSNFHRQYHMNLTHSPQLICFLMLSYPYVWKDSPVSFNDASFTLLMNSPETTRKTQIK